MEGLMNQALYLEYCRADKFFYDVPDRAIAKSLKFIDGRDIPADCERCHASD